MAGSVNKVQLIGNLGRDPESRTMQTGGKVVSFSIATSETWNDKGSGERKERTQWHRIVIYNDRLGEVAERYLKKGAKVYLEGQLESRKFTDKEGQEREATEVVLRQFRGELVMLDGKGGDGEAPRSAPARGAPASPEASWDRPKSGGQDLDDEIPF